jgi:initiation factor 1A
MPKNLHGGNKHKKHKNTKQDDGHKNLENILYANNNQVYAYIVSRLGGSRISVNCSDGKSRSAIISGKFKNRVWLNKDDIVLCDLYTTGNDNTCTVVHKYNSDEIMTLKYKNLLGFCSNNCDEEENYIDDMICNHDNNKQEKSESIESIESVELEDL